TKCKMISSIRLQNFRSYSDDSFEFEPGVNIVIGPNASGKTNLLEAVLVLARGTSFRARDGELIKFGKAWARLDGSFEERLRTLKLEPPAKTFILDDKPYRRLGLEKTVPVVLFEPSHLQLLSRGPDQRRDYFDDLLERAQPTFKSLSASYKRSLAQRNALLKRGRRQAAPQLFAWNIRLSELGSQIAQARQNLADEINQGLAKAYGQIAKAKLSAEIKYDSQFPAGNYASRLLHKLETSLERDLERGFTGSGPHRDDFIFYLNKQSAAQTASRGETRSLVLALKLFELKLIEQARDQKPIFLLDDVFSELDGARRRALVARLATHQTIITTTDADAVLEYFSETQNLIPLS
ncbi:MAG TPA: DNA replication/repair protein RecF, partial [Candidatus Saccharimonadales bacterium]|nr:DNA replication/repair protein RecF [Candidatus Saccharimonadales bacterium]